MPRQGERSLSWSSSEYASLRGEQSTAAGTTEFSLYDKIVLGVQALLSDPCATSRLAEAKSLETVSEDQTASTYQRGNNRLQISLEDGSKTTMSCSDIDHLIDELSKEEREEAMKKQQEEQEEEEELRLQQVKEEQEAAQLAAASSSQGSTMDAKGAGEEKKRKSRFGGFLRKIHRRSTSRARSSAGKQKEGKEVVAE